MKQEYLLIPEVKNLQEIRGIEEISLSLGAKRLLPECELVKAAVNCEERRLTLWLKAPSDLDEQVKLELQNLFTGLFKAQCQLRILIKETQKDVPDWNKVLDLLQQELPGIYGWLSASPPEQIDSNHLLIKVNSSMAVEYLKRQEEKLTAFFQKELGAAWFFRYEVIEEDVAVDTLSFEEEEYEAILKALPAPEDKADRIIIGSKISGKPLSMKDLDTEETDITLEGLVIRAESRKTKTGKNFYIFDLTDFTDSITVKVFPSKGKEPISIIEGMWLKAQGDVVYDNFSAELVLMAKNLQTAKRPLPADDATKKRVELHLHTKMSAMDSTVNLEDAVRLASSWGHKALAITDHGVAHSFPEAAKLGAKYGIKIIYGLEGYLVNDETPVILDPPPAAIKEAPLVIVDLETTGLNPQKDDLLEIGAVRVERGEITKEFSEFVRPGKKIPYRIRELTGITDQMVEGGKDPAEALTKFLKFADGAVLAAHNAQFDLGFLKQKARRYLDQDLDFSILDTLALSRALWPDLKSHRLSAVAKELGIKQAQHHRAFDDARTAWEICKAAFTLCQNRGILEWTELNRLSKEISPELLKTYHILILAADQTGLNNLYRLVSYSHTNYFHRHPRIPRSLLSKHRQGLLLGSACEAGELFTACLNGEDETRIREIAGFYDFLEIQPLGNNDFLVKEGRVTKEELEGLNKKIYQLGRELDKPVVATGDVHFLRPADEIYRRILMAGQGYEDADQQPPVYLRTTDEMLEEFSYLAPDDAYRVVVEDPLRLEEKIADIQPVPEGFYPPKISGAAEEIKRMSYAKARELYGDPLPSLVKDRLEMELESIIAHGYAVLFLIAHKLVKKSLDDGYLVGSRGSVGSSFVATMCGITEVNPLPAHYRCAECLHSEFSETGSIGSGYDLPAKDCPQCGKTLLKDGQDIPFATFMGFEGDKEPDIDLNFSGEYQAVMHRYTEELFGEGYVFRAGTITSLAEKMAFGFVRGYMNEKNMQLRQAEINRLVSGCTGVRRSSGQHPGGLIVLPQDQEIYNFTPIQYPANDRGAEWVTTHFDYHGALEGRLVKLDILGHDDPTVIRMLHDLTGVDPLSTPMDDPLTMKIFSSVEPLGISAQDLGFDLGALGIPEFGTGFVRQMLKETRPTTFSELLCISGLSHGTNVWLGNAQELIKNGTAKLLEVISTRDNIMNDLIYKGLPPKSAFQIMEKVRKGRDLDQDDILLMREHGIPEWYIDSCNKIKYLFPKAHATAYVMMAFRIAYFKVHYPEAFYATYFTVRADDFDADTVLKGADFIRSYLKELQEKGNEATAKERNLYTIMEIAHEALLRGLHFLPVDLYQSDARKFLITEKGLRLPFVSLQGLGENAARNIAQAREEQEFYSIEDLKTRARLSSAVIEVLRNHGSLQSLPATNQLTLF